MNAEIKKIKCGNDIKNKARTYLPHLSGALKSERGIALVLIIILSAILLVVMAGMLYMISSGTQVSGMQKRYRTAMEAAVGGSHVAYKALSEIVDFGSSWSTFNSDLSTITPQSGPASGKLITTQSSCTGTSRYSKTFSGVLAKIYTPSSSWSSGCYQDTNTIDTVTITPSNAYSYDLQVDLGTGLTYRVYMRIVDTFEGNSAHGYSYGGGGAGSGTGTLVGLSAQGVAYGGSGGGSGASSGGQVVSIPYIYTLEIDAEDPNNPKERAKLSVLYQY
jgi:hypothetical protein